MSPRQTPPITPHCGRALTAALSFAHLPPHAAELQLLHRWLDSWRGIGDIVGGMRRLGYDLQLVSYGNGMWRATFWVTGSTPPALGGSAYEMRAWKAVERAASDALTVSRTR